VEGCPAWEHLDNRCGREKEKEGVEPDGGGALEDAASLVRACLQVAIPDRPTFEELMQHRFLAGASGWSGERPPRSPNSTSSAEPGQGSS
jgi:protein-serine/threonine kinase